MEGAVGTAEQVDRMSVFLQLGRKINARDHRRTVETDPCELDGRGR